MSNSSLEVPTTSTEVWLSIKRFSCVEHFAGTGVSPVQLTSGTSLSGGPPRGDLCGDMGGTRGSAGESRGEILRGPVESDVGTTGIPCLGLRRRSSDSVRPLVSSMTATKLLRELIPSFPVSLHPPPPPSWLSLVLPMALQLKSFACSVPPSWRSPKLSPKDSPRLLRGGQPRTLNLSPDVEVDAPSSSSIAECQE